MSTLTVPRGRQHVDLSHIGKSLSINLPSGGVSQASELIAARLREMGRLTPTSPQRGPARDQSLEEKLYDTLADFKVRTASIAMHLDSDWRTRLFRQLDSLLDAEEWQKTDLPPGAASFSTFLRTLLLLKPERRPGLGATADGHLLAAWTLEEEQLTLEFLPDDLVRWVLRCMNDGDLESAAGLHPVSRLPEVLKPYSPERWFASAHHLHSA